jgi:hypothetical protein
MQLKSLFTIVQLNSIEIQLLTYSFTSFLSHIMDTSEKPVMPQIAGVRVKLQGYGNFAVNLEKIQAP